MPRTRVPLRAVAAALLAAVLTLAAAAPASAQDDGGVQPGDEPQQPEPANPCGGTDRETLRCPDLQMSKPFGIRVERTKSGRVRLRAGNSINSRGRGPLEVRGERINNTSMKVRQAIYRTGGRSPLLIETEGRLDFKDARPHGLFWKYRHPARFELWSLDSEGKRKQLVRTGPKVHYCLRDLNRTAGGLPNSPSGRVYPACNQDKNRRSVRLGTSVGWSDVYPPTYPEQYIDVTGLRGTFSYRQVADPRNTIHESNESNNDASLTVRLPLGGGGSLKSPDVRDPDSVYAFGP